MFSNTFYSEEFSNRIRFVSPLEVSSYSFITREPSILPNYHSNFTTFELESWLCIILSFLAMSLTFKVIHWVYQNKFDPDLGLVKSVVHEWDFVILTLSTLVEPDPIPWFPKMSTGKCILGFETCFEVLRPSTIICYVYDSFRTFLCFLYRWNHNCNNNLGFITRQNDLPVLVNLQPLHDLFLLEHFES